MAATRVLVPYHLDEYRPDLDVPLAPDVTITAELPAAEVWDRLAVLYERVAAEVAAVDVRGDLARGDSAASAPVVVQSGDCTTSFGVVAGLQRLGLDPGIVWFDAHGDVQTLETTTSGYLGGMPLRMLTGYRPELIAERLGLARVREDRVVLVGARDLDPPEREYLESAAVREVSVESLDASALPAGPLYLHVDFDVVDPGDVPGLLFPAADGPSLTTVTTAVQRVLDTGRVAAVGFGCTWRSGQGGADRVGSALGYR